MALLYCLLITFAFVVCMSYAYQFEITQPNTIIPVPPLSSEEYQALKQKMHSQEVNSRLENHSQIQCGNDKLLKMYPSSTLSHDLHHELFQQTNSCPIQSQCDVPSIRDEYTTVGNMRQLDIEFVIERGTTLAASAAEQVALVAAEMNTIFNPVGFNLTSTIILWGPLTDRNRNPIGDWYVNLPCETSTAFSQPCVDHVFILNSIFQQRGGYRKPNTLSVLVAQTQSAIGDNLQTLGFAYFPWMLNNGIMVVIPDTVSSGRRTIPHELGHALGLWHTHRGSYEISFDNTCPTPIPACYEGEASDVTGDYCSDTGPFPNANVARLETCTVPTVAQAPDICNSNRVNWAEDGINNLMSYMPNDCRNVFTEQQGRRMRCYFGRYGFPTGPNAVASIAGPSPAESISFVSNDQSITIQSGKTNNAAQGFTWILAMVFCILGWIIIV